MLAPCGLDCDACPQKPGKCDGCHSEDGRVWDAECRIRMCCKYAKGLDNCAACGAFPCQVILDFESDEWPHHTEAVKRLRAIRARSARPDAMTSTNEIS